MPIGGLRKATGYSLCGCSRIDCAGCVHCSQALTAKVARLMRFCPSKATASDARRSRQLRDIGAPAGGVLYRISNMYTVAAASLLNLSDLCALKSTFSRDFFPAVTPYEFSNEAFNDSNRVVCSIPRLGRRESDVLPQGPKKGACNRLSAISFRSLNQITLSQEELSNDDE